MKTSDTCKLRYHGPAEADWHIERMSSSEADIRKRALEQGGYVVEVFEASVFYVRLGSKLDPRRLMN